MSLLLGASRGIYIYTRCSVYTLRIWRLFASPEVVGSSGVRASSSDGPMCCVVCGYNGLARWKLAGCRVRTLQIAASRILPAIRRCVYHDLLMITMFCCRSWCIRTAAAAVVCSSSVSSKFRPCIDDLRAHSEKSEPGNFRWRRPAERMHARTDLDSALLWRSRACIEQEQRRTNCIVTVLVYTHT